MLINEAKRILEENGYCIVESMETFRNTNQIYYKCNRWLSNGDDGLTRRIELDRVFNKCLKYVDLSLDDYEVADKITRMIIGHLDEDMPYPWEYGEKGDKEYAIERS